MCGATVTYGTCLDLKLDSCAILPTCRAKTQRASSLPLVRLTALSEALTLTFPFAAPPPDLESPACICSPLLYTRRSMKISAILTLLLVCLVGLTHRTSALDPVSTFGKICCRLPGKFTADDAFRVAERRRSRDYLDQTKKCKPFTPTVLPGSLSVQFQPSSHNSILLCTL